MCEACGALLVAACSACGTRLPPDSNFCNRCGTAVSAHVGQTGPPGVSAHARGNLGLVPGFALAGERKHITVLLSDLKDSLNLLANRDPEDARMLLDPILERMMDAVHRYEGTVNQIMGDGIMALFGAPVAQEDHAIRACYAALRMQESVKSYSNEMRRVLSAPVQLRVGLNSGEVVVRAIGSDLRMDYSAVGQTTHLAGRMEQLAVPGTVLITTNTFKLVEGQVEVKPLGAVPMKGLDEPIDVYELVALPAARSRLQAAAVRGLTPFVGREAELAILRQALATAAAGEGRAIGVRGEPGVGKTRLYYEFSSILRAQGWVVLETSAVSYDQATPYIPVFELLRAYFGIESAAHPREVLEQVMSKLLELDRKLEAIAPPLLALLGAPPSEPSWQALDPLQRRQRTLHALAELFGHASAAQPLCLLVENLHWIDSETRALLDLLIAQLGAARFLLLTNYRPGFAHGWNDNKHFGEIVIGALPPASAEELLDALVGRHPSLEALKMLLIDRTGGNPFFLEQSIRNLTETAILEGERGAYRLVKPLTSVQVPATVQAMLASRIDRLSPQHKSLLQIAAVIGKNVDLALLEAVTETTRDLLPRWLSDLSSAGFLYVSRGFPEFEYTFTHALTQEVAYRGLLHEQQRLLHRRIMEKLEALGPGRLTDLVERLAHHAFRGELWEKAATYLREAGMKAFAQSAHRAAAARFEQALTALGCLPPTQEVLERRIDVRLNLRNALLPVGETETVLRHLREAEKLADALGDRRRSAWVSGYLSASCWSLGDYAGAVAAAQRTIALGREIDDDQVRVYADIALTWACHSIGDYREGARRSGEAVERLRGPRAKERFAIPSLPAVLARTWLVSCLVELGEFASAGSHAQDGVVIAESVGEPWTLVNAYLACGIFQLRRGDFEASAAVLEKGLQVCRRFNIEAWFTPIASSLGYAQALSNKTAQGIGLLEQALAHAGQTKLRFYHSLTVMWLAEGCLLANRVADARKMAEQALDLCETYKESGNRAYTYRVLGDIAAHPAARDFEGADKHYAEALVAARELGMRPLAACIRLNRARLQLAAGRAGVAADEGSQALSAFREMAMEPWAQRTVGTLAQVLPRA